MTIIVYSFLSVLVSVLGKGALALERQISFSDLMADADLEVHRLSFQQVDLPLTYPEILVLCQSYALVDASFVPKLTKVNTASRFLVLMGVGRVMGMFLAFSPGQIPPPIYHHMTSLEKLIRLMTQILGFELPLLEKIVANSQIRAQPLLSSEGQGQVLRHLKRRLDCTTEIVMGNRALELLAQSSSARVGQTSGSSSPSLLGTADVPDGKQEESSSKGKALVVCRGKTSVPQKAQGEEPSDPAVMTETSDAKPRGHASP